MNTDPTFGRRLLLGGAAGLLAGTAAHAATPDPALATLADAARGEAELVLYTAYGNLQPLFDIFAASFPGIRVRFEVAIGAPLLTRVAAEAASGNHAGDLVLSGAPDMDELGRQSFLLADLPPTANGLAPQFHEPGNLYQVPFRTLFSLVYNTNRLGSTPVPTSLDEVLSEPWKRRFTYARPTGATAFDICLATLGYNDAITDNQLALLAANGVPGPGNVPALATVAEGRFPLGLFMPTQNAKPLQADGAPIGIALLPDSAVLFGPGLALLRDAPHPNAAKLFKAWLFTPAGQAALAQVSTAYGTMPGAPAPDGLPSVAEYRFKDLPPGEVGKLLASFRQRSIHFWH